MSKYDLEERLIEFAVLIIKSSEFILKRMLETIYQGKLLGQEPHQP